jgi:Xaa-Pro aminopeptidase
MLDAVRDSVLAGVETVAPGRTLGDVARACDAAYDASAFARSGRGARPALAAWGHSLGLAWERPWIDASSTVVLEPGMCLAIEKRVAEPGLGGATYEDDVLVTEAGYELLTPARHYH